MTNSGYIHVAALIGASAFLEVKARTDASQKQSSDSASSGKSSVSASAKGP